MRLTVTRSNITNGGGTELDAIQQQDPNLDLNFEGTQTLTDDVSNNNLVTFTRASSGTYVDGDGLIKTTPMNLLTYSEQFDFWLKTNSTVTANVIAAPNGSITADQLNRTSTSNSNYIRRGTSKAGSSIVFTASIYFKKDDARYVSIRLQGSYPSRADVTFDLDTGTISRSPVASSNFSGASAAIVPVADGWYRCSLTATTDSHTTVTAFFSCSAENKFVDGTSAAINSVYVWGAQLEKSSTATDYIPTTSAKSGAPRFDHDPATGESLGLLIEEARTNDITNNYSTASTKTGVSLFEVTSIINPDGTTGAIKATTTATTNQHSVSITTSVESTNHSVSAFVKKGNHRYVGLTFGGLTNNIHCIFDFDTKTIIDDGGTGTRTFVSAGFEEYANGWFRLHVVGFSAGSTMRVFLAENDQQNGIQNWTSSGGEFMYIWGPQKEAGSFPTSYIPTSGSTVTRAADVAEITGADFAKTNLLQYSERFEEWDTLIGSGYNAVVTPNATQAPDETLTADKFVGESIARLYETIAIADGTYTLSFYLKSVSTQATVRTNLLGRNPNSNEAVVQWDLSNGSATVLVGSATAQIVSVGSGWFKCSFTYVKSGGSADLEVRILDNNTASDISGMYVWGAQLEEGDVLTDYTPSVESFVSRASSATYVDDTTGLIKTTPVNLLTNSNTNVEFSNSGTPNTWTSGEIAPDGSATAKICTTNNRAFRDYVAGTAGDQVVYSVHLKAQSNVTRTITFKNRATDIVQTTKSINITTDWQRFDIVGTVTGNPDGCRIEIGGGIQNISAWGAQLEEGSTATPYIKTTSTKSGAARYENGELILEEARTNIIDKNTSEYNSIWFNVVPPGAYNNAGIAPDGTNTAFATTSYDGVVRGQKNYITAADTNDYTFSIFIKSTGGQGQYISHRTGFNGGDQDTLDQIVYDFASDTVGHGYSRKLYANGWVRIWKTYTNSNITTFIVGNKDNTSLDILFWGAQLEQGSYPSSLIITPDSADVTRAADVSTSALGVDTFYNQSEGTVFSDVVPLSASSLRAYVFSDGTNADRIGHSVSEGNNFTLFMQRGSSTTSLSTAPSGLPKPLKATIAYKSGSSRGVINGDLKTLSTTTDIPTGINQVSLGIQNFDSSGHLNGHIKRFAYFNTRLPDATLQSITS